MPEPRLYLYRKAGRVVWDAEFWLADGKRRTWRTGLTDRDEAEAAARDRLALLHETPPPQEPAAAGEPPVAAGQPVAAVALDIPAETGNAFERVPPRPRPVGPGYLQRLDQWFFADLKNVLSRS